MSYKTVTARQLHKRMAHHYTQASLSEHYTIMLTTIIRDFGLHKTKRIIGGKTILYFYRVFAGNLYGSFLPD